MKFINEEHTLWQDDNRSGTLEDPHYLAHVEAGGQVDAYVPPAEPPATSKNLTKRQINAALIAGAGQTDPDGFVEGAIATLADPVERALALNDWRHAPYYTRSHPLFNAPEMLTATGLTAGDIDNLWALGVTLPA